MIDFRTFGRTVFILACASAVVWALLAIAGCKDEKTAAIPKPTETITFTVTIVPDPVEMQELRKQVGPRSDRVRGFATWFDGPGGKPRGCHIYVPPINSPDDWAAVETYMHEVGHCVAGAWHN